MHFSSLLVLPLILSHPSDCALCCVKLYQPSGFCVQYLLQKRKYLEPKRKKEERMNAKKSGER